MQCARKYQFTGRQLFQQGEKSSVRGNPMERLSKESAESVGKEAQRTNPGTGIARPILQLRFLRFQGKENLNM